MKLKYYTGSQVIDILYSCLDYMQAYEVIKKLAVEPSADVVEVVRCKDCIHNHEHETPFGSKFHICNLNQLAYSEHDDFYCAYGERREDD